jgi:hypothetical protein
MGKAGLEDRLHDELEGHLRHAILERRDPQATHAAIALGDHPLTDRQRPERPRPKLAAQLREEPLHAECFDVAASRGIDPGRP